jgi:hypothetical protein
MRHDPDAAIHEALSTVADALGKATDAIADQYVRLPVVGGPQVARERLYCYELYHQIRCALGDDFRFSVGGEVDKSGHRVMRGPGITNTKPDLLIHVPGDLSGNLVIIEVKSVDVHQDRAIRKDLETLTAFRTHPDGGYRRAYYLFFGGSLQDAERARERCVQVAARNGEPRFAGPVSVQLDLIDLLWHGGPGEHLICLPWRTEMAVGGRQDAQALSLTHLERLRQVGSAGR